MRLTLLTSRTQVNRTLIILVLFFTLMSLIGQFALYFLPDFPFRDPFINEFNVDGEENFPTLYSALTLLFSSILLAIIAYDRKIKINRYASKWQLLSGIFLFISLDELTSLHENLVKPLRRYFNFSGFLHFGWVLPIGILVVILAISFIKFLLHLPLKVRVLFIVAGAVYVFGALGMEIIGGKYANVYGQENFTYQIFTTLEEFLEMTGIIIFINALLYYMSIHNIKEISIELFLKAKTKSELEQ